jgi:hypothetical protein
VDPKADLDDMKKRKFLTLSELEVRPLGRPAHSQSLYRLSYPGSSHFSVEMDFQPEVDSPTRLQCKI